MFRLIVSLLIIFKYGTHTSHQPVSISLLMDKVLNNTHVKQFSLNPLTVCHAVDAMLGMEAESITTSLAGLLGRGFDPLTSVSTFYMLEESFSHCSRTPDYRFYVPDNSTVESIMDRYLAKSSVEHEKSSKKSENLGLEGGVEASSDAGQTDVGGSFSAGFQKTKSHMEKKKESLFTYSLVNKMYRLTADRSTKPASHFQYRLKPIIQALHNNENEKARYLVQQIITDFGTHVTTEVIVGTLIQHRVFVKSSVTETTTEIKIKAKAKVDVTTGAANVSGAVEGEKSSGDGEGSFDFQMDIQTWVQGGSKLEQLASDGFDNLLDDTYPVALSSSIKPIYLYMQSGSIENVDYAMARTLRELFEDATNEYFERNTFYGCTNGSRANFDFQANADDNTCKGDDCTLNSLREGQCDIAVELKENLTAKAYFDCAKDHFVVVNNGELKLKKCREYKIQKEKIDSEGGMYQTCRASEETETLDHELAMLNLGRISPCEQFRTKNVVTNDYSCNANDKNYTIISYTYKMPITTATYENVTCFDEECFTLTAVITFKDVININSYWCQPENSKDVNGIQFEGYFDIGQVNNFNGQSACPYGSETVTMFLGTTFCVVKNGSMGQKPHPYNALLTMLYSSKDETQHCKSGHSRQLITVVNGEKIYACILKRKAYYNLPSPRPIKGPYMDKRWAMEGDDYNIVEIFINGNLTNVTSLDDIGNKFSVYIDNYLQELSSGKENDNVVQEQADKYDSFFEKHKFFLIAGLILIILCLVAVIYACNCF